jgi:hypothetical protein
MQIFDIFHNCPEQEQEQQQSDPKDLGSKFPRSKNNPQITFARTFSRLFSEGLPRYISKDFIQCIYEIYLILF